MAKTKEQKRLEADARNAEYRALTLEQKRDRAAKAPGYSTRQLQRLARQK